MLIADSARDNRTISLDGARLSNLRRARAISQEQLAALSGGPHPISVATIKRAERGTPVYLETARRLSELLGVAIEALLASDGIAAQTGQDLSSTPVGVAVRTFRTPEGDAPSLHLAQGLVEDLTTRLSGWWFPVICRASTFNYGHAVEHADIARDLHIGYIVEGAVRRDATGTTVRVQCRLLEARTGVQIWAGEHNREYTKVFALQDELTAGIVDAVRHKLLLREAQRIEHRAPGDLQAWELAIQGALLFHERRPASNQEARRLLQQSLQRDPQLDWAFYLGGLTHQQDIVNQWSSSPQASVKSLNELSVEFERKHPIDPRAQLVRAYALLYLGQREAAHDRLLQSLESAPNQHLSYLLLGQTLAMADSPDPAIEQYEIATRLSPRDCDLWSIRTATALTHFVAERLEQALIWAESALQLRPDLAFTFGTVASISALCGDLPKAKQALSSMLNINPNMTIERFAPVLASTHPGIAQRYLRGLKLAGLA